MMQSAAQSRARQALPGFTAGTTQNPLRRRDHCVPAKRQRTQQHHLSAIAEPAAPTSRQEQDELLMPAPAETDEPVRFNWFHQWYPVMPLPDLVRDKPSKVKVLGLDIVLWPDQEGKWRAAKDACPHRLAALSEGWLENGQLQCRYHGWAFAGSGQCVSCPQASPELDRKITQGTRGNLQTFPTLEQHGLLWVWPDSSPEAWIESSANPPATDPEVVDPAWASGSSPWSIMEFPVSWQSLVENSMDPTHGTFLHEGIVSDKTKAAPVAMSVAQQPTVEGFQIKHDGYTKQQKADPMDAIRVFRPPGYVRTHYKQESGKELLAGIYFTPVEPQKTRIMGKFVSKPAKPTNGAPKKKPGFSLFSLYIKLLNTLGATHVLGGGLGDQDVFMQHTQEVATAKAAKKQRSYRLATPADTGVATVWRWLDLVGGIPYADGSSMFDLKPRSRTQLLDRWNRHTKHCLQCQKALKKVDLVLRVLQLAAAACIGLAVLQQQAALPLLGLAAAAVGLRVQLARLRQGFFTSTKPPGSQWHEKAPTPAVDWVD